MKILEAQFRQRDQRWQLRLLPEGSDAHDWRDWQSPSGTAMDQLFASLFETDQAWPLLKQPWHLRLRPEHLGQGSQGIPAAAWSHLIHPDSLCHILDLDWTVTELVERPRRGETSGQIAVLGNRGLTEALRRTVGPIVSDADPEALGDQSILVACGKGGSSVEFRALKEKAVAHDCPLIIFCGAQPPSRADQDLFAVPSIFSANDRPEAEAPWLARFLTRVVRGVEPVVAFAEAGRAEPRKGRVARRMWGAHEGWKVSGGIPDLVLPRHWYISLDRSKQESHLNTLVEGLTSSRTRRVQVVVTPGPEGAGLDLFRQRPPRHHGPQKLVQWDLGWAENPANTIERLKLQLNTRSVTDIVPRLQEQAARHEGGALFLIRHETVSLEAGDKACQVTLEELKCYLKALRELALALSSTNVYLLVHVSVLGENAEALEVLEAQDPHFMVDILEQLDVGVPRSELKQWFRARGLNVSPKELDELEGLNYDELIQRIVQRSPELLHERTIS
jgi:hypothetical protein